MKFSRGLLLALCAVFTTFMHALDNPHPTRAHGLPISSRSYRVQIILSDGEYVRMSLHEGEMGTITTNSDGRCVGFVPVSAVGNPDQVEIRSFIIATRPDGNQTVKEHESILLGTGGHGVVRDSDRTYLFELMSVNPSHESGSPESANGSGPKTQMMPGGGNCCVTCGNVTACGCAVEMSCGSCCSVPCC